MNKVLKNLVVSSVNPEEVSLTIKGVLVANIAFIMILVNHFNLPYSTEQVTEIIGVLSGLVGGVMVIVGLLRKLYHSIKSK